MTPPLALQPPLEKLLSLLQHLGAVFLEPGSLFSFASLGCSFVLVTLFLVLKRKAGRRRVRLRALMRALFPKWMIRNASTKADVGFFFFNTFPAGVLIGWAILSGHILSQGMQGLLTDTFGARTTEVSSTGLCIVVVTVTSFLAYEFGYWVDHWLKHRVQFLWEFHKVHHTAEVLTPLTSFRMHPGDTVVFANIVAVCVGVVSGITAYGLGRAVTPFGISGTNVILVAFIFLLVHLQHSQIWIAFTGVWGRLFISPAHHQLHHSTNPAHFGRNFGSCLAIWDWMFGTLNMPTKAPQKLTFGVAPVTAHQHSITGTLITPFVLAGQAIRGSATRLGGAFARAPSLRRPSRLY